MITQKEVILNFLLSLINLGVITGDYKMNKIYENLVIDNLDGETWKTIIEYPDYQISNLGRVKSFKQNKINGKILRQQKNEKYLFIVLCKNREYKHKYIHRLVYEIHNYKLKYGEDVHHIDKNEKNNFIDNLMMIPEFIHDSFHTKGENHPLFGKHHSEESKKKMSEKKKGKYPSEESKKKMSESHVDSKGENNPNSILITQDVIQIKLLLKERKLIHQEIAEIFGVCRLTISAIKTGKIWSNIKI